MARILPFQPDLNKEEGTPRRDTKVTVDVSLEEEAPDFYNLFLLAEVASYYCTVTEGQGCGGSFSEPLVEQPEQISVHAGVEKGKAHTACGSFSEPLVEQPERISVHAGVEKGKAHMEECGSFSEPLVEQPERIPVHAGVEKGKAHVEECGSFSEPLVEQPEWISVHVGVEKGEALMKKFLGISFYKRTGRWSANIWFPKQGDVKGKQKYIGAFATATEAMRAYDKASIKYFGDDAKLNYERTDYLSDINEMDGSTDENYISGLMKSSNMSMPDYVAQGITKCPEGMFEVKILNISLRKKEWKFLGRFDNQADAKRLLEKITSTRESSKDS